MSETMPRSAEGAAYAAFAIVDELIKLMIDKNILVAPVVEQMFVTVAERLSQESNLASKHAAHFVTNRMTREE